MVLHRDDSSEVKAVHDDVVHDEVVAPSMAPATSPTAVAELVRAAADPALTEDFALALLKRSDLPAEVLEQLAKNVGALKSRKVKVALASHARTPRHISVPLARQFYTFDLMKVALSPRVPADVRVVVDNVLISRLQTVTVGERLTLARRASGRVAAALLLEVSDENVKTGDARSSRAKIKTKTKAKTMSAGTASKQPRVMQTALDNPRLGEMMVINSVLRPNASAALVHAVSGHAKWSRRKEIRAALLRTEYLSLARALEFSQEITAPKLDELLANSRLPTKIKELLLCEKLGRPLACGAE
jgi:hypothetical protein